MRLNIKVNGLSFEIIYFKNKTLDVYCEEITTISSTDLEQVFELFHKSYPVDQQDYQFIHNQLEKYQESNKHWTFDSYLFLNLLDGFTTNQESEPTTIKTLKKEVNKEFSNLDHLNYAVARTTKRINKMSRQLKKAKKNIKG